MRGGEGGRGRERGQRKTSTNQMIHIDMGSTPLSCETRCVPQRHLCVLGVCMWVGVVCTVCGCLCVCVSVFICVRIY